MLYEIGYPKTQEELFLEYARVIAMCEDYVFIQPFYCVRQTTAAGCRAFRSQPAFKGLPTSYDFAVGILEDTPVFRDSVVFDKKGGQVALPYMDNEDILSAFASGVLTLQEPSPQLVTLVRSPEPRRRPKKGEYVLRAGGEVQGLRGFVLCVKPGQWNDDEEIWHLKEK